MSHSVISNLQGKSWRHDAVRIVEDLFPQTPPDSWDMLLELRRLLVEGSDWNCTLDVFLDCRRRLETAHYLPFYRLRMLLTNSLALESGAEGVFSLRSILRRKHRSLADIRRHLSRDLFEHDLRVEADDSVDVRVVERV